MYHVPPPPPLNTLTQMVYVLKMHMETSYPGGGVTLIFLHT